MSSHVPGGREICNFDIRGVHLKDLALDVSVGLGELARDVNSLGRIAERDDGHDYARTEKS